MKYKLIVFLMLFILATSSVTAQAQTKSTTITLSPSRHFGLMRTQDAYLPDRNISNLGLSEPESLALGTDGMLYIADTGNRRVVVFNTITNEMEHVINLDVFRTPRGVFITNDNVLYVADSGASAIFVLTPEGELLQTFSEPPDMPMMNVPFAPVRVAVDNRRNMFIVGEGVFNGIIHLTREGEFLGFFASNETQLTWAQRLQAIFMTERQRRTLDDRNPLTFSNVTVDRRGVVYTTTTGSTEALGGRGLKRHDMSGRNTIVVDIFANTLIDVVVDDLGNIFAADADGFINVFTNSGDLIFRFGAGRAAGTENIAGWFRRLVSLAVTPEGVIWALDGEGGFLQSFTPTEYATSIYQAIYLFNLGYYADSGRKWENVLRRNQMSVLAHAGLGLSHFYLQNFEEAQYHFFLAGHQHNYGVTFWETRNIWLLSYSERIIVIVFALFLLSLAIKLIDRKRVIAGTIKKAKEKVASQRFSSPMFFAFAVAKNPLDNFYYLKLGQKGNALAATVYFVLFFVAYMLYQTSRGFAVQFLSIEHMDFMAIIGLFFIVFILFVVSNFLVTSINGGEGGLKLIYSMLCYATFPLTIALLLNTVISHVVTQNEAFLLSFIFFGGIMYFIAVVWVGLQEIHNYSFSANCWSLILTAFFMIVAMVSMYIVTILFGEVINFFDAINWEVRTIVTG